ncbi:MAG: ATP-binding cassette domain-containing protein [Calditrichaeota bacterium]|nr:ATP-binding cassette domain-containing protein [Calditrichota bacterium]
MIDVKGLTRYYGEKRAISDVTFHVNKGEILGLLGPNAAGKTTTMRILTCYMPPTSGSAKVGGYDIFDESLEIRKITGYLPENPPLYTDMTVDDYLTFVSKIKGVEKKRIKSEVDTVVEKASIGDVRDRIIGKLSKGFKQRVGLAQSLINNPQIVILDEPTVGLDPKQIIEIRQLIKNLKGDHTVILSSHILPEIEQTCERVVIINEGKVVAEDTVENLTNRLRGVQRITLLIEGNEDSIKQALQPISDIQKLDFAAKKDDLIREVVVESEKDIRKDLAKAVVNNGLGLLELSTERFTLEEIFLHLTTKEEVA